MDFRFFLNFPRHSFFFISYIREKRSFAVVHLMDNMPLLRVRFLEKEGKG